MPVDDLNERMRVRMRVRECANAKMRECANEPSKWMRMRECVRARARARMRVRMCERAVQIGAPTLIHNTKWK